jgi:hypothetical protein
MTPSDEVLLWAMAYQGYEILDADEGIQRKNLPAVVHVKQIKILQSG